ncbi:MAG: AAA family ATPase [Deltaproteobacteria bacterium]|nr:MAG: AAA family ATPase [Deltaproteobacteria bacterium]
MRVFMVFFIPMAFVADLHVHSHFSRATSRDLTPEYLSLWAQKKGIAVIGTGDITHPGWLNELREKLMEAEAGLYRLRPEFEAAIREKVPRACQGTTRFVLSGEISCIYKKDGKTRKLHHLVLMPDMESVERLNAHLDRIGNITSDGRPILGLDSRDLLEIVLETEERAFFIPAHIWTPWFSLFGSKSGFDHLEECFGDLSCHIHALETGLSSDPPMNRRWSALDGFLLVSNSDAHSPSKLGREANLFDAQLDYPSMIRAMTDGNGFVGTIEFFPEEGKYHLDGHRKCGVRLEPAETRAHNGLCPECGKPLTVGVLHRVDELADRTEPVLSKAFLSLIPLTEILSELFACGPTAKKVVSAYEELLNTLSPELQILMEIPLEAIEEAGGFLLKEAIKRMREGRVILEPGFDGQYGRVGLFQDKERAALAGQMTLFHLPESETEERSPRLEVKELVRQNLSSPHTLSSPFSSGDPIVDPLNSGQREAVLHQGGHLLVVAGPGTGKTMTLTHRIAYLLRSGSAQPHQILALTFTRKAAKEMADRVGNLVGKDRSPWIQISTFHGFCLDLLQDQIEHTELPRPLMVCAETDTIRICQNTLAHSPGRRIGLSTFRRALYAYKLRRLRGAFDEDKEAPYQVDEGLLEAYQQQLQGLGMVDLDDLEIEALRLLQGNEGIRKQYASRFPWIFVDEYQDTNPVQVQILKMLVEPGHVNLFAIGDPDQAIYGFRGADVGNFYRFTEDFPGAVTVTLRQNYRSTQKILASSAAVMGKEIPLEAQIGEGDPIFVAPCGSEAEEAEMIVETIERLMGGVSYFSLDSGRVDSFEQAKPLSFGDFAVLYRLNAQADALQEALARRGIPFVRSGESPLIERFPVDLIWRFLQHISTPNSAYYAEAYEELLRCYDITRPEQKSGAAQTGLHGLVVNAIEAHGLGDISGDAEEALRRFEALTAEWEGDMVGFLDFLSLERGIDHHYLMGDRIALMTLHAAKGLEWPVVFITGCENGLIPYNLYSTRDDEEERRLFYVGMTRAGTRLILSWAKRRRINGRTLQAGPSPFLAQIPDTLKAELDRRGWRPKPKRHQQLTLF